MPADGLVPLRPGGAAGARAAGRHGPARRRSDDDGELVRRFAAGELRALHEVYARYAGPVYTVALARLGDRHLAEEAVQDTFVKAWRAAASFDVERPLSPWLYEIARRSAADIARRERRRSATAALPPTMPAEDAVSLADTWEAWEVRCALRDLPGEERELLRLTHYLGLSQSQIAERLGIPLGTVKSRVHRAHHRLADRLAHLRA
jgi:RNA polymerase sigma-70 factor (ECF subfamily)